MTGIIGGERTGSELSVLIDNLHHEPWYETTRGEARNSGFALVEHGDRDPFSNQIWENDRYQLVIHGIVSNFEELSWTTAEIISKIFDQPNEMLSELEGPFLLACHDREADRFIVATDKLGSRPCYYTNQHDFQFASEVSALLPAVTDPTVNRDGIADLLLFGAPLADHTLVEEVKALPPATVLTYDGGDVSTKRYWKPQPSPYAKPNTSSEYSSEEYVDEWLAQYERSLGNVAKTVAGDFGLWLSGGIDSRMTAIALQNRGRSFDTFTYQTRFQSDQPVARKTANALGVRNYQVNSGPPEKLRSGIKKAIDINDGMQNWSQIVALPFMMHELSDFADVVMEGSRFLGEDVWAYSLQNDESPKETLLHKKGRLPEERVEKLVGVSNPASSLQKDLQQADADSLPSRLRLLDAMRRFYSRTHMRSNMIQRSQVGTRVVSDGSLVNLVLNMPDDLRMRTIPGTGGKLPYGVPKIKLKVMRKLKNRATEVPYQRSLTRPQKSMKRHVAGFYAREFKEKLVSPPEYPYLNAYRNQPAVRQFLNGLLDDAKRRDVFDADEITRLQDRVSNGDSKDISPIAAITGVEYWLQTRVDKTTKRQMAAPVDA